MGHYSSFIIRLWVDSPDGFEWGVIQHVATREERRFNSMEDMLSFIGQYAGQSEASIPFSLDGAGQADGHGGNGNGNGNGHADKPNTPSEAILDQPGEDADDLAQQGPHQREGRPPA